MPMRHFVVSCTGCNGQGRIKCAVCERLLHHLYVLRTSHGFRRSDMKRISPAHCNKCGAHRNSPTWSADRPCLSCKGTGKHEQQVWIPGNLDECEELLVELETAAPLDAPKWRIVDTLQRAKEFCDRNEKRRLFPKRVMDRLRSIIEKLPDRCPSCHGRGTATISDARCAVCGGTGFRTL